MLRAFVVVVLGSLFWACDPIRVVSASSPIDAPLERTCVVEALRAEDVVRTVGVSDSGAVYAELLIPEDLDRPESRPEVRVETRGDEAERLEIDFSMLWVGGKGSADYRAHVQRILEELRDRTIEKCGGPRAAELQSRFERAATEFSTYRGSWWPW